MASIEIHIPISPRPSFFLMVHFFAASLRRHGGAFRDARIVVSVGEDCEPFDLAQHHRELAGYNISWRWTDRAAFREQSYYATALRRWQGFESDYVVMADADTLVVGDISEALRWLDGSRGICGVIGTYPPFMARGAGNTDAERWQDLFHRAGLAPPSFDCRHPGFGRLYNAGDGMRDGPPYFNYGFVLGTRDAMCSIADTIERDFRTAFDAMKTDLSSQASLTLSIARNGVGYAALPVKFNMWTRHDYVGLFPEDFADVRLLHYHSPDIFAKGRDIESLAVLKRWLDGKRRSADPLTRLIADTFGACLEEVESECRQAGQHDLIGSS